MTKDARFEDASERPLRLKAEDASDLRVISALVQDSVLPASEMKWQRKIRRFSMLLNRFRWEDAARRSERARSLLVIDDALRVERQGIDPSDPDLVLSILEIGFDPGPDGGGRLHLTFAGDGAIGIDVESLNIRLQDVTRPYLAPSAKTPSHPV